METDETEEIIIKTVNFVYKYNGGVNGEELTLTAPINFPLSCSPREYVGRFVKAHNIPEFAESGLMDSFASFVSDTMESIYQKAAEDLASNVNEIRIEEQVKLWTDSFHKYHKSCREPEAISDADIFGQAFHAAIHSPQAATLLSLEYQYTKSIQERLQQRRLALEDLDSKNSRTMKEALENVTGEYSEAEISNLASKHFESMQIVQSQYASELSALRSAHRTQFTSTVMALHEEIKVREVALGSSANTPTKSPMRTIPSEIPEINEEATQPVFQESFTVNLGAQLKTSHNIRLVCLHPFTLLRSCAYTTDANGSKVLAHHPHRLQTLMSLYSTSLSGIVLLVDDRVNSYKGIKKDFAELCEQGPELHFPSLEEQLNSIRQHTRNEVKNGGSGGDGLRAGSVYVTRHSNLAEAHVVLHLVVDDSVSHGDINSRHPAVMALRNILKMACRFDVTTLSIPLLLTYELTEEMTVPWCMKRAELVYKCVKGFMIEMSSWDVGNRSHTMQFIVPEGISDEMFAAFSNMLPQIFTISKPLMLTSN